MASAKHPPIYYHSVFVEPDLKRAYWVIDPAAPYQGRSPASEFDAKRVLCQVSAGDTLGWRVTERVNMTRPDLIHVGVVPAFNDAEPNPDERFPGFQAGRGGHGPDVIANFSGMVTLAGEERERTAAQARSTAEPAASEARPPAPPAAEPPTHTTGERAPAKRVPAAARDRGEVSDRAERGFMPDPLYRGYYDHNIIVVRRNVHSDVYLVVGNSNDGLRVRHVRPPAFTINWNEEPDTLSINAYSYLARARNIGVIGHRVERPDDNPEESALVDEMADAIGGMGRILRQERAHKAWPVNQPPIRKPKLDGRPALTSVTPTQEPDSVADLGRASDRSTLD